MRIEAARKRKLKAEENTLNNAANVVPTPGPALRSNSAVSSAPRKKACLFPESCIICSKTDKWIKGQRGTRERDKLVLCQSDVKPFLEAAENHNADHILRYIRDQDPVASEVKYHKTCYRNFTNSSNKTSSAPCEAQQSAADKVFSIFSDAVVVPRLIAGDEVLKLSYLHNLFSTLYKDTEGEFPPTWFTTTALKRKLQKKYPQLTFAFPRGQRNVCQIVFLSISSLQLCHDGADNVTSEEDDFFDSDTADFEMEDDRDCIKERPNSKRDIDSQDLMSALYRGALALQHVLKNSPRQKPKWPQTAEAFSNDSLKQQIPVLLYNFLAWPCDMSDDDVSSETVQLKGSQVESEMKLCSIAQDVICLATRDVMPKQLMLSLTIRHISGSKRLVDIVSGLGHGASYTTVLEHDTAVAKQETSDSDLPSGFQKNVPVTLVWDNNYFCEETPSGRGTTHCTTGIIVQRSAPLNPGSSKEEHQTNGILKTPGCRTYDRSFKPPEPEIIPFLGKRKLQPLIHVEGAASNLDMEREVDLSLALDLTYYICKAHAAEGPNKLPGWSGFNTVITPQSEKPVSKIGYLPIIHANPTEMSTVSTILHRSVHYADELQLQSLVIVMDQALYGKAQEIRWMDEIFKQRLVVRLGEFHMTMCFLSVLSKRFNGSGLEDIMIESGLVAAGSTSGVTSGRHYNRSVRAHKIVAEALSCLRWEEFLGHLDEQDKTLAQNLSRGLMDVYHTAPLQYKAATQEDECQRMLSLYIDHVKRRSDENPTYNFWSLHFDGLLLQQFIRATRTGDWALHLSSVRMMLPYFFAYDCTNYARYTSCYLSEMESLKITHPHIDQQMQEGDFCVQRQHHDCFAQTACDQVIEQSINKHSKSKGGLVGKTRNKGAVQRWIVTSHIRGNITETRENVANMIKPLTDTNTKYLLPNQVKKDEKQVSDVLSTMAEMISPFGQTDDRLINISNGIVPAMDIEKDLLQANQIGLHACAHFKLERIETGAKSLYAPLKCKKLKTFANQGKTVKLPASKDEHVALKARKTLLTRMLHLGKLENDIVKDTLAYCLVPIPPCLGHYDGSMTKTNKSKLLQVFSSSTTEDASTVPDPSALIVDGMAVIQATEVGNITTFDELSEKLIAGLRSEAHQLGLTRIDFVINTYPVVSIKNGERKRRAAAGGMFKVKIMKDSQSLPRQWKKYLADGHNKADLCEFLFQTWSKKGIQGVELYITHGIQCHCIGLVDGAVNVGLVPDLVSDHEEADTRLFLHAVHASATHAVITIRSPDTDVSVIAASVCGKISSRLLIRQTQQKVFDLSSAQENLSESYRNALLGLHVFTGCDSVSAGKGKMKALRLMESDPDFVVAFQKLGQGWEPDADLLQSLERFVCHLFGQRKCSNLHLARYNTFCQGATSEKSYPPTQDCLKHHALRANYQAAIYRRSLQPNISAPSPVGLGWQMEDGQLVLTWTTQPLAPEKLLSEAGCRCKKKSCAGESCGYRKQNIPCSDFCGCQVRSGHKICYW